MSLGDNRAWANRIVRISVEACSVSCSGLKCGLTENIYSVFTLDSVTIVDTRVNPFQLRFPTEEEACLAHSEQKGFRQRTVLLVSL